MSKQENNNFDSKNGINEVNEQDLENVSGGMDSVSAPSGHQSGSFNSNHKTSAPDSRTLTGASTTTSNPLVSDATSAERGLKQDLNALPGEILRNPHGR